MTDAPAPSPAPAPAPGVTPSSAPSPAPAPTATRPDYVPETYWDATANSIKPEFGQHYTEVSKFYQTETEKRAALAARKPEDIKFEIKLPDTVKVPDGFDIKVDEKDPRVPVIREMALKNGWSQDTVNVLVALDARMKIEGHAAETARIEAEDKKLGDNAKPRKEAVGNWLKGLKENGKLTGDEYEAVKIYATDAASVTALEKLMAMAGGSVPGNRNEPPPREEPKSHADRIWPGGFSQKAS
jgi:hypothetical protein